jgi:hypothetical protein
MVGSNFRHSIKGDAAFENAEEKIRDALRALKKVSSEQLDLIKTLLIYPRLADGTKVNPKDVVAAIVEAFAEVSGKNPCPQPDGKGIVADHRFRLFIFRLRQLAERCGSKLPMNKEEGGGSKFKAVMETLRYFLPSFIPQDPSLSNLARDWSNRGTGKVARITKQANKRANRAPRKPTTGRRPRITQ